MNAALLRKTFKVFIFNSFREELWRKSQSVRGGRKGKTFWNDPENQFLA